MRKLGFSLHHSNCNDCWWLINRICGASRNTRWNTLAIEDLTLIANAQYVDCLGRKAPLLVP